MSGCLRPGAFLGFGLAVQLQLDHRCKTSTASTHVCRIAVGVLLIIPRHSFWSILRRAQNYQSKEGSVVLACHHCWRRYRQSAKKRRTSALTRRHSRHTRPGHELDIVDVARGIDQRKCLSQRVLGSHGSSTTASRGPCRCPRSRQNCRGSIVMTLTGSRVFSSRMVSPLSSSCSCLQARLSKSSASSSLSPG